MRIYNGRRSNKKITKPKSPPGPVGPTRHPFCLSPIVAGGPLRAKATAYAALRAQALANFSRPLAALAVKTLRPDLALRALSRPKSPVPEGKRTGGNAPHREVLLK